MDGPILVTGAGGFIGRNLVRNLLAAGESVVAVDRAALHDENEPADLGAPGRFVARAMDTDQEAELAGLLQTERPRVVISLAEGFRGDLAEAVPESVQAQAMLCKTALAAGVQRVCLASSIVVYMGLNGPFREDMPLPITSGMHIAAMKKASEVIGLWYDQVTPLEVVTLRLANVYGPRYHSMMNTLSRYLYEALGRPAIQGLPPLDPAIYRQVGDFCHVDDCCDAIRRVAKAPSLKHRIYNIGGGRGVTDAEIRQAVARAVEREAPRVSENPVETYLDISRIRSELGFEPRFDITSGVRAYRDWLRTHDR